MARGWRWIWLVGTLLWIAGIAWIARSNWPMLPLDVPASDPEVRAALSQAVATHVLRFAGVALIPPILALIVLRSAGRA